VNDSDTWLSQRERGTLLGIRVSIRLAMLLGRRPMRLLVDLLAMWYRLFDRTAVRASRDWLHRVQGRRPGFWAVYRHLRTFAQVTMDRVFMVSGRTDGLCFTHTGQELLRRQLATGRGAVLLGAHLGSFEAMRASGSTHDVPIRILGYFQNARMINALLADLDPARAAQVIHFGDDPVGVMARVRACIDRGELIALLGDRVGLNERVVRASFLDSEARFAAGPFLLAALLHCPVFLVFGLYREPNCYDLHCELFAEQIDLPRRDRAAGLERCAQRYAERLEDYCRRAPDNWFNFFDFWSRE